MRTITIQNIAYANSVLSFDAVVNIEGDQSTTTFSGDISTLSIYCDAETPQFCSITLGGVGLDVSQSQYSAIYYESIIMVNCYQLGTMVELKVGSLVNLQGGGGGAKVYRALLTYSGGNVVVEELENGLSGTPTWTRSAQGVYLCTLTGEFSDTRTFCQATGQGDYIDASNGCLFTFYRQDVDTCILTANGIDVNDSSHGLFDISSTLPTSVEIIVYP